ncbi:hypothetical protein Scep_028799 [Stephania cephalantha]|uniref:Uncharacterized protein n=1 Tax=Stephania cephalantha TaxID=152367 RepID=A0AAP0EF73_9MAGN
MILYIDALEELGRLLVVLNMKPVKDAQKVYPCRVVSLPTIDRVKRFFTGAMDSASQDQELCKRLGQHKSLGNGQLREMIRSRIPIVGAPTSYHLVPLGGRRRPTTHRHM